MRRLRMERVTPQAEEEVRTFIRESLKTKDECKPSQEQSSARERMSAAERKKEELADEQKIAQDREVDGTLLARISQEGLFDFLSDGVALCRYVYLCKGYRNRPAHIACLELMPSDIDLPNEQSATP
jgi:hypothetical protein